MFDTAELRSCHPLFQSSFLHNALIPALPSQRASSTRSDNFLLKLWKYLLDNPTSNVIYWSKLGTHLIIPDEEALVKEVVLKLYKQKDYASFARQLNIYSWKRFGSNQLPDDDVPENSRIWRHDYLTRDSAMTSIAGVKRNAISKRRAAPKASQYSPYSFGPSVSIPNHVFDGLAPVNRRRSHSTNSTHSHLVSAARQVCEDAAQQLRPLSEGGGMTCIGALDDQFQFSASDNDHLGPQELFQACGQPNDPCMSPGTMICPSTANSQSSSNGSSLLSDQSIEQYTVEPTILMPSNIIDPDWIPRTGPTPSAFDSYVNDPFSIPFKPSAEYISVGCFS